MSADIIKKAIEGTLDLSKIAVALLDTNPDLFIELARKGDNSLSAKTLSKIKFCCQEDRIVEAIKALRVETGIGLKEAKDVVFNATGRSYFSFPPGSKLESYSNQIKRELE